MYIEWLRNSSWYVVKCVLLLQLIYKTTGAGCSVDHGSGMNYPTTTASGTWTTRGGISSYGWDSRQPIDPCSRCTNVPPPLPGSQYTTQSHDNGMYSVNDRISVSGYMSDNRVSVSGYMTDNRGTAGMHGSDNRHSGYGSDNRGNGYGNDNRGHTNNRPNGYSSIGHVTGNGYMPSSNYAGNSHVTDNHVQIYNTHNVDSQVKNPNYRGNGYDNLSPEWERRHNNKKVSVISGSNGYGSDIGSGGGGSYGGVIGVSGGYGEGTNGGGSYGHGSGSAGNGGSGYYQGMSYPVPNIPDRHGTHMQSNYHRPSNDRWNIKGAYPVKIESGYWQSQPPKDIGWDEASKKVGVIAGWIGGPQKYESSKPSTGYGSHQLNDKNDNEYYNKGTGYENNSDRKKPYMGWGGSGSYEVVKMNNGYKYIDRNSNSEYGSSYGNGYGYGGQSYNNKPSQDYGLKPMNVDHGKPYDYGTLHGHDKPKNDYGKPTHNYGITNSQDYGTPTTHDYGSSPHIDLQSTPRPIGFEVTTPRPPAWDSQKPGYPVIASRPTQHWGENSFGEQLSSVVGGSMGYDRPGGNSLARPVDYGSSRPDSYGAQSPVDYGSSKPGSYGTQRPVDYGSSRPDSYGIQRPVDYGSSRPGSYGTQRPVDYGSSRPDSYGTQRPVDYGSSRPDSYGTQRPENYGSSRPGGYGSSRPDGYGSSRPGSEGETSDYGAFRPYVGSMNNMISDYGSQKQEFDKFSGYSDNDDGRPQMNNRPGYNNERPYMNGNEVYGSQQQTGSGYGKGYASNWDYYSNSMRGQSSNGWNDQQREYLQRRPDGDVLQSGSSFRPSESTPLHYNGHSGIGASTDNGFLYRSPSTIIGSSTTPMPTTNNS